MNFQSYKSILFDCDGVILNSNHIKTKAFEEIARPYGSEICKNLVNYHIKNGGISRHQKLSYFVNEILKDFPAKSRPSISYLIDQYSERVKSSLLKCEHVCCLDALRKISPNSPWFIVSGGDQLELHYVFKQLELEQYFNGGIWGSPASKEEIFSDLVNNNAIKYPALYLGDSKYDYVASQKFGLDFIFVEKWSDLTAKEIQYFKSINNIKSISTVKELTIIEQ